MITCMVRSYASKWREAVAEPGFISSLIVGLLFFFAAFGVNMLAIQFATERASNPVTDLILSNTPVFDVDDLFVYGTFVFAIFAACIVFVEPKRIPFALKACGIFWIIRSMFASLTHVAPFPTQVPSDFGPTITKAFFGADRFFSAHTGQPFLGALAFWEKKWIRSVLLAGAVFFGVVVLLGHLHYSIDVAAAFFITYGIFHITQRIFPREWHWFESVTHSRT